MILKKAYKINLSTGPSIRADQDEIEKVMLAVQTKNFVLLRDGMLYGPHFVSMTLDKDRLDEWHRECERGGSEGEEARNNGMQPIKNIFAGTIFADRMIQANQMKVTFSGGGTGIMPRARVSDSDQR